MTTEKIFQDLNSSINALSDGKITVVFFSEFGAVSYLHYKAEHCELSGYAQYKNGIAITGKKYRARTKTIWYLYEAKTFAIFRGWLTPSKEQPKSWCSFDKSVFYSIVDSLPKSFMLGEWSERTKDHNTAAPIYKVYAFREDRSSYPEVFQSAEQLVEKYEQTGTLSDNIRRRELQGAPYIKGFCGPMYDGLDMGRPVIRYESPEVYDILSA